MKNFNEMFVGLFIVVLASLATLAVAEENRVTTIEYENGDIYTVPENENVFVSTQDNLFSYHPYQKAVQFKKQWPTDKVDKPVPTPNPNPAGSHEWCKAHVPYEIGYSFSDQTWERHCDTNDDRKYGCGDEKFDASDDSDVCLTTSETTGSTGTAQSTGSFTDVDEYGFSQACADFDTDQQATFGYISWQQICDTNNDGEYSICDYYEPTGSATFADIQYNKQCSSSDGS